MLMGDLARGHRAVRPALGQARRNGSPLRILHVAQTITGGIASYLDELAGFQATTWGKDNVRFLIPKGSDGHLTHAGPAQVESFEPVGRGPRALFGLAQATRKAVRRFAPDIVHVHSSFAGAVVRSAVRRDRSRPCLVYCPHGWAFGMEVSIRAKVLYAAAERSFAALTDLIIVNSRSELDLAVRFGLPAAKLRVVSNGIAWSPRPTRPTSGDDVLHLGFVGRHDRQKGLDILLDTLDRFALPGVHLHIVGDKVVECSVARPDDRTDVTSYGWLARAEVEELLRKIDVLIMPSRWEAFGLTAIEAMRAGVPVIGSNRGALPEVIRDGVGGYIFDLDNRDALGRVIGRLDRAGLRRLGYTARRLWEAEYGAERMNALIVEVYEEALAQRGLRAAAGDVADNVEDRREYAPSRSSTDAT